MVWSRHPSHFWLTQLKIKLSVSWPAGWSSCRRTGHSVPPSRTAYTGRPLWSNKKTAYSIIIARSAAVINNLLRRSGRGYGMFLYILNGSRKNKPIWQKSGELNNSLEVENVGLQLKSKTGEGETIYSRQLLIRYWFSYSRTYDSISEWYWGNSFGSVTSPWTSLSVVSRPVGWLIGRSLIISLKDRKLHFHAPLGTFVLY